MRQLALDVLLNCNLQSAIKVSLTFASDYLLVKFILLQDACCTSNNEQGVNLPVMYVSLPINFHIPQLVLFRHR
ncbi:hypothetical protein HanXRQr2_Chr16g0753131 [Helianthus annuus]|uniref:Uncharacterized protein n=1 Tax=Helianthus annuus TaxID=4232 RepID=A0A9K3H0L6_HELAN|nr:hypothetical protein HanXRQr2_Chr16g0753131 [Helianthus annuus]KAJ0821573.1 hypothetical protein HanPSC8_Chr16g0721861 [Helianthus annuus]